MKKEELLKEIEKIENFFLNSMREKGVELSDDAVCYIRENSIELGISADEYQKEKGIKIAFASDVTLYARLYDRDNEINYGSSGCFTPLKRESYWRTIHAASILKNWDVVSQIINECCEIFRNLMKRNFEENLHGR